MKNTNKQIWDYIDNDGNTKKKKQCEHCGSPIEPHTTTEKYSGQTDTMAFLFAMVGFAMIVMQMQSYQLG